MCLVVVVVRVLAEDDAFDARKRGVSRPGVDVGCRRENGCAGAAFGGEEALE